MTRIANLIALRQQEQDETTEAITARIPISYVAHLDEISYSLGRTRQSLLTDMIKDKVDETLVLFYNDLNTPKAPESDDEAVSGSRFFILNTNKSNDEATHRDMVTNGVAAAFGDPWKFHIERIKEGDTVFLYENGVGIVGTGIAASEVEKVEYESVAENAYQKKLTGYRRVNPLSARDIKKVVGSNLIFLQTLIKVPAEFGKKIQKRIQSATPNDR